MSAKLEIKNKELAALPLVKGRIVRQWVVAHLKDKPLTLAERTFMDGDIEDMIQALIEEDQARKLAASESAA